MKTALLTAVHTANAEPARILPPKTHEEWDEDMEDAEETDEPEVGGWQTATTVPALRPQRRHRLLRRIPESTIGQLARRRQFRRDLHLRPGKPSVLKPAANHPSRR